MGFGRNVEYLRNQAKEIGMTGFWKFNQEELRTAIWEHHKVATGIECWGETIAKMVFHLKA